MQASSLKQGVSLVSHCWVTDSAYGCASACLSPFPIQTPPFLVFYIFLRHQHKMELAGGKNNLSKMAECSRECQAVMGRERAPPAVQHRDPKFFFLSWLFCIKTILRGEIISVINLNIYIELKLQGAEIKAQTVNIFFSVSKDKVKVQSEQTWVTVIAQSWLVTVSKSSQKGRKSFYSTLFPQFQQWVIVPGVPQL